MTSTFDYDIVVYHTDTGQDSSLFIEGPQGVPLISLKSNQGGRKIVSMI